AEADVALACAAAARAAAAAAVTAPAAVTVAGVAVARVAVAGPGLGLGPRRHTESVDAGQIVRADAAADAFDRLGGRGGVVAARDQRSPQCGDCPPTLAHRTHANAGASRRATGAIVAAATISSNAPEPEQPETAKPAKQVAGHAVDRAQIGRHHRDVDREALGASIAVLVGVGDLGLLDHAPDRIDVRRDAGVDRSQQRLAVFDGPKHGEPEVLGLLAGLAEPRVVGEVDQRVDALVGDVAGERAEDVLVADQRAEPIAGGLDRGRPV